MADDAEDATPETDKPAGSETTPAPRVAIPLPPARKRAVIVGCVCMMLSVAMYGLVFATLTSPILESVDAMAYVSLFTTLSALGISVMTPIGGKLGDMFGRRTIVVAPGLVCAACGIAFAFARSLAILLVLRMLIGFAQGAFTAAPYIIAGLVNERRDVPRAMGVLATSIAVGGFGGSVIAGILCDMGLLRAAVIMPAVPLLAGVLLIGLNMPNDHAERPVTIDWAGIAALTVALCGIFLPLNFAPTVGWANPLVLGGLLVGICALAALLRVERSAPEPIIPLHLFSNRTYSLLLIVGFICYFYQTAMNTYAPIGAMQVMGASAGVSGSLQLPRTLLVVALPALCGTWMGRRASNAWVAMAIATGLVGVAMAAMGLTSTTMPVTVYFVALALTGVAESFRSVSITSTAQGMLEPAEMGVGTALVNFVNSLASTIAAAVTGVAYDAFTAADPTSVSLIQGGVNAVFLLSAVVSFVGLAIVVALIRPALER